MKQRKKNVAKPATPATDWQPSEQTVKFAAVCVNEAVRTAKREMIDNLAAMLTRTFEDIKGAV